MDYLELLDWRRRVAELFAEVRRRGAAPETVAWYRKQKDLLFRDHSQTPLTPETRTTFQGLPYWAYDPDARVLARFTPVEVVEEDPADVPASGVDPDMSLARIGTLDFTYQGHELSLGAYWIRGYAGGLFVPFRDATSGHATYGAGRYLLDTIKGADLGTDPDSGRVILDFNYAYHPSCAYDYRWVCPLAPAENWLTLPVEAGERLPTS